MISVAGFPLIGEFIQRTTALKCNNRLEYRNGLVE